jgi:hypothetical protein
MSVDAQSAVDSLEIPSEYKTQFAAKIDSTFKLSKRCLLTYSSDSIYKCLHLTLRNDKVILIDLSPISATRKTPELVLDYKKYFIITGPNHDTLFTFKILKKDGTKTQYMNGGISF